jgi:SAM-dependent methyltransferase
MALDCDGMEPKNRASLTYRMRYATRNPGRIVPYARRLARDTWLRARARDHVAYYRSVMRSDTARSPYAAVGAGSRDRWEAIGRLQFDYLLGHGLKPTDRFLEIGCGNLRAGRFVIDYLDTGNYYGIDISPDILFAAQDTLTEYKLQDKLPHLTPVRGLRLEFLPEGYFSVVHAHSVFSHSPIHVIEECLANIGRVLAPGGFFDFTFNRTDGEEHHVLREDFYYRTSTLMALAKEHDLNAEFMDDWEHGNTHKQSKLRITHGA